MGFRDLLGQCRVELGNGGAALCGTDREDMREGADVADQSVLGRRDVFVRDGALRR